MGPTKKVLNRCSSNAPKLIFNPHAVIGDNSTTTRVFETSSVMGVQLLQSFISVVVMLLLLLSGDVETNPGPGECISEE